MKTFIVRGQNWQNEVQIPDGKFDKYGDAAFEAMTQGLENFFNEEYEVKDASQIVGLGWIMMAFEEGYEDNPDKTIAALTEFALVNAGYYKLADEAKRLRKQAQIWSPTDDEI
jgi:hypothetical protein